MQSAMMADLDFGDGEPFHFHQGGKKPVHTVEQNKGGNAFPAKRFEGASGIRDGFLTQLVAHCVGDFGGYLFDPGIIALMSPAADHIELLGFFQKQGDVCYL